MVCPHCRAPTTTGVTFCPRCRKRVLAPSWSNDRAPLQAPALPPAFARPRAVTLLAILDGLLALVLLLFGAAAVHATTRNSGVDRSVLAALAIVAVPLGCGYGAAAVGLWGMKRWGRTAQIVMACVSLVGIPIGTVVGGLLIGWLLRPGARTLFSGRAPAELSADELAAAQEAARETGLVTGAAVAGLVLAGLVATVLAVAIAIPMRVAARVSANESAAVGDVRTVVAAQGAYRSANGHYDRLECLAVPSACVPGFPAGGPAFLAGRFVSNRERDGYSFHLEPGPSPQDLSVSRSSASSMDRFAYLASPVRFRSTGRRIFCGDDTGRVCAFTDLGVRRLTDGRCSADCTDLP